MLRTETSAIQAQATKSIPTLLWKSGAFSVTCLGAFSEGGSAGSADGVVGALVTDVVITVGVEGLAEVG